MGNRVSYTPGTFSWVELATTDAAAATAFYGRLFGWETDTATFRLGGDVVAGVREVAGGAQRWTSHVTVADAAAVAARAQALGGGAVLNGRAAVIEDPQGAVFTVRQAGGAERVNDVGCLCMNELQTTDVEAAASFYEGLFGWTTEAFGPKMKLALNEGRVNASLAPVRNGAPPNWRACFTVESTETAARRIRALGGAVVTEPFEIPDGSLAVARDPQGAVFAVFAGEVDP